MKVVATRKSTGSTWTIFTGICITAECFIQQDSFRSGSGRQETVEADSNRGSGRAVHARMSAAVSGSSRNSF